MFHKFLLSWLLSPEAHPWASTWHSVVDFPVELKMPNEEPSHPFSTPIYHSLAHRSDHVDGRKCTAQIDSCFILPPHVLFQVNCNYYHLYIFLKEYSLAIEIYDEKG